MDINTKQIRELADLAIEKNLAEIIVQDGDKSVTIKLPMHPAASGANMPPNVIYTPPPPPVAQIPATSGAQSQSAEATAKAADEARYHKITSPMVGTFYSAPSPDSPPFVAVGQTIAKGQTLCIIEAMKLMNELESEVSGKVVKIVVENGQPVEFGQTIMLVDPG